jgi:hypothetical protein
MFFLRHLLPLTFLLTVPLAQAGGITAGGGGITPAQPVTIEDVRQAVLASNEALHLWLQGQEIWWRTGKIKVPGSAYGKLFSFNSEPEKKRQRIYRILSKLSVEFRENDSCYDSAGTEKDGSIYTEGNQKLAICISGRNLAQKLNRDDYEAQTAALILHEVSHLLGTDEHEAMEIQERSVAGLRRTTFANLHQGTIRVTGAFSGARNRVIEMRKEIPTYSGLHDRYLSEKVSAMRANLLNGVDLYIRDYDLEKGERLLSPLSAKESDLAWATLARMANLEFATCDQRSWSVPCAEAYEKVFNGATSLYGRAFYIQVSHAAWVSFEPYWQTRGQFFDLPVPNIRSMEDLSAALSAMEADLDALWATVFRGKPFVLLAK